MRTLEDDIRALSAAAVKQALDDGSFDFMAKIGNMVPITVVARLIGFRDIDPMQLLEAAFDSTTMVGGTMSMDELSTFVARTETIEAWIADQIAGTGEGGEEGILLAVRRALDAGTLRIGEATIILHTMLSAGGESTTSLLGNAVRMLAENPGLQQRLREKPQDIDVFVEEALRLESPFRQMMRSVPRDTTLGGVEIASGSTVLLLFAAGNRDPAQFKHPDRIDLTRESPNVTSLSGTAFISASGRLSRVSKPVRCSAQSSSRPDASRSTRIAHRGGWTACWSVGTQNSTSALLPGEL